MFNYLNKQTVSRFHQHNYITFMYTIVTKTRSILHYSYYNVCTPIVTYFTAFLSKFWCQLPADGVISRRNM